MSAIYIKLNNMPIREIIPMDKHTHGTFWREVHIYIYIYFYFYFIFEIPEIEM